MHEKVKEFIDSQIEAERKQYEENKQKTLEEIGLYDKIYSERSQYNPEFPFYESKSGKWFNKKGIDVTDEEFEVIKKYYVPQSNEVSKSNSVATTLKVIAWITFICGFIAGIVLGNVERQGLYSSYTVFSFAVAFIYWCISLISGMMFLGLAEIINLLNVIKNK